MLDKIMDAKKRVLEYMDKTGEKYGPDRLDVAEYEKLADIVKDLSEAEKACWEAEYYQSVTEAMDSQGYMPEMGMGYNGRGGSQGMQGQGMQGGRSGYRDSRGRFARRGYGYHQDMESLREQMQEAAPAEREKMTRELRQMLDM